MDRQPEREGVSATRKLTRREAALVAHAKRRAVEDHEHATFVKIYIGQSPKVFFSCSLADLRAFNVLRGLPGEPTLHYGEGSRIHLEDW